MAEGDEEIEEVTEEKPAGSKKKLLIIIITAVVLLAGGGTAAFMMMGDDSNTPEVAADGKASDSDAEDSDTEKSEEVATAGEAYYFSLDPPFIVNFSGKSRARFLQVSIEGLTRDAKVKEDITKHFPQVRNNLVMLLSAKTYDELSSQEGKVTLRKQVLKEIQKVLEAETGHEGVEDVFFTSFVMQ